MFWYCRHRREISYHHLPSRIVIPWNPEHSSKRSIYTQTEELGQDSSQDTLAEMIVNRLVTKYAWYKLNWVTYSDHKVSQQACWNICSLLKDK
jgi:hypothetical protein